MSREMLIINGSSILQKIISAYVSTELSDVAITIATTSEEGLDLLKNHKFDVVLSALEMADMDGIELRWEMSKTELNSDTPFIIMTSTATPAQKARLAQEGVQHALYAPYTSQDLARVVNQVCDPRGLRHQTRYSIPGAVAASSGGFSSPSIKIINFSLTGLLGELPYPEDWAGPLGISTLDLTFPPDFGGEKAADIEAVACRTWVMSWGENDVPTLLRIAWKFVKIPASTQAVMEKVLDEADRQHAYYEEDAPDC